MQFAIAGIQATMQQTVAREMGQQKLHLISQDAAARQIDVLSMGRYKGHRPKLHSSLFRRAAAFMVITPFAGGHHILPDIPSALADWLDVIA